MKTRSIKLALIAAAIAALPTLPAIAADAPTGFDGCVKAFVSSLSARYASAPRLRESRYIGSTVYPSATNQLSMTATNPQDHRAVARAVCTYNAQGDVLQLQERPLSVLASQ